MYVYICNLNILIGTFIKPATTVGPSTVCVGSSVTFNCTIRTFLSDGLNINMYTPNAVWKRNGVMVDTSTLDHTLLPTERGSRITGLMVTNTTLDDNGTVYTCTATGAPDNFTSSVVLNIAGGIIHIRSYISYIRTYVHILHLCTKIHTVKNT